MTPDAQPRAAPAPWDTVLPDWPHRAARLRDELISAGKLWSPAWCDAVTATPRHHFVPAFHERRTDGGWERVAAADPRTRHRWADAVWANRPLVTQLGPIADGGPERTGPTSSASAPSLVTRMLEALDVHDGHHVLELGTGTGYNAALLCHRLGAGRVVSLDIDPHLVADARERLRALGHHPTLAAGDGAAGLAEQAPYDRIIATCAVRRVPGAWLEQIAQGGLVLVDVKAHAAIGNLVLLRRHHDRLEGLFDAGTATFMQMRTDTLPGIPPAAPLPAARDHSRAHHHLIGDTERRLWTSPPLWFLIHLAEPGRISFGYAPDVNTGEPANEFYSARDGSWCEIIDRENEGSVVVEGGPRRLWTHMGRTVRRWNELGRPGWPRLGLTVHDTGEEHVWVDEPERAVARLP